jgi:hypothetical protein
MVRDFNIKHKHSRETWKGKAIRADQAFHKFRKEQVLLSDGRYTPARRDYYVNEGDSNKEAGDGN